MGFVGLALGGFKPGRSKVQISDSEMKYHKSETKLLAASSAQRLHAVEGRFLLVAHLDTLGL
jgi:hypothetical protein